MTNYERIKDQRRVYLDWMRQHGKAPVLHNRPERPEFIYDDVSDILDTLHFSDDADQWELVFYKIFSRELDNQNAFNQWTETTVPDDDAYKQAIADAKARLLNGDNSAQVPKPEQFTKRIKVFQDGWDTETKARECVDKLRTEKDALELGLFVEKKRAEFEQWKQENKAFYETLQTLSKILDFRKLEADGALNRFERSSLFTQCFGDEAGYVNSLAYEARQTAIENYRPGLPQQVMECLERAAKDTKARYYEAEQRSRVDKAAKAGRELLKKKLAEIEALEKAEKKAR